MADDLQLDSIKRDLVVANRILAHEGVLDGYGHVSLRSPIDPQRYFLSRSRSPELVGRDDIMEFTLDSEPVDSAGRSPYLERVIHGAIYQARPDVHAVVHHHAASILPFTFGHRALVPVFHPAAAMGETVPVWDSQPEFGDTNMLIDDMPKARSLARALGSGSAVLVRGHGACCVGRGLKEVVFTSIYMVVNGKLILDTLPMGEPIPLTRGEIAKTAAMSFGETPLRRAWDYWVARAGFVGL